MNIQMGKYGIRLSVPSSEGMSELWVRCEQEGQYAQWMAACRVAAKGKSLADITFDQVRSEPVLWIRKKRKFGSDFFGGEILDPIPDRA